MQEPQEDLLEVPLSAGISFRHFLCHVTQFETHISREEVPTGLVWVTGPSLGHKRTGALIETPSRMLTVKEEKFFKRKEVMLSGKKGMEAETTNACHNGHSFTSSA